MELKDDDKRVLNERNFPEKIRKMIEDMPKDDIMRIHDFAEYVLIKERVRGADMKSSAKLTDKEISKIAEEGSFDGKMAERIDYAKETDYLIANYKWKRDNGLNEKKYELTDETMELGGYTLHRIKALKDFGNVKKGDLGGFIEKEDNLSHEGNCWVYGNACVFEDAEVREDAKVFDEAEVYGDAKVYGNAEVYKNAEVYDNAKVYGNVKLFDEAKVYENAEVYDKAEVSENGWIFGNACVFGNAEVYNDANVYGNAKVYNYAKVFHNAHVYGNAKVYGKAEVFSWDRVGGDTVFSGFANSKKKNIELD